MKVKVKVAELCLTLRPHGLYSPWNSPGQNTGVGSRSLLQGIFPTQESNPGLPRCRRATRWGPVVPSPRHHLFWDTGLLSSMAHTLRLMSLWSLKGREPSVTLSFALVGCGAGFGVQSSHHATPRGRILCLATAISSVPLMPGQPAYLPLHRADSSQSFFFWLHLKALGILLPRPEIEPGTSGSESLES